VGEALDNEAVAFTMIMFGQLALNILSIWLNIGVTMFILGIARGEEASFGLIFAGGRYLLPVILCYIIVGLAVFFGFLLLIVPGIILWLMLMQAHLLIIDRNVGVMESLSLSSEVMSGNKVTVFLVWLVAIIVGILFVLVTCGLGLLAFAPYLMILIVVLYLMVTGQPTMADRYAGGPPMGGASPFDPAQSGGSPFDQPGGTTPGQPPAGDSPFGA